MRGWVKDWPRFQCGDLVPRDGSGRGSPGFRVRRRRRAAPARNRATTRPSGAGGRSCPASPERRTRMSTIEGSHPWGRWGSRAMPRRSQRRSGAAVGVREPRYMSFVCLATSRGRDAQHGPRWRRGCSAVAGETRQPLLHRRMQGHAPVSRTPLTSRLGADQPGLRLFVATQTVPLAPGVA